MAAIARAFPNSLLIIPFRAPLEHADSLLEQHRRFLDRHRDNRFETSYMEWLAHHEFGSTHKPFVFDDEHRENADPMQLEYWLDQWLNIYGYLLDNAPEQTIFVSYERLCDGDALWQRLAAQAQLGIDAGNTVLQLRPRTVEFDRRQPLYRKTRDLHQRLKDRCDAFVESK